MPSPTAASRAFHGIFRYLEGGMNLGAGVFGLVAPQAFLPSMFPALAASSLLQEPMVLLLGRQLAMLFLLAGMLLWALLRTPRPGLVRWMLACFLPTDLIAIGLFVHSATQVGWHGGTVFNIVVGLLLMLARLPYIWRPELALGGDDPRARASR